MSSSIKAITSTLQSQQRFIGALGLSHRTGWLQDSLRIDVSTFRLQIFYCQIVLSYRSHTLNNQQSNIRKKKNIWKRSLPRKWSKFATEANKLFEAVANCSDQTANQNSKEHPVGLYHSCITPRFDHWRTGDH